MPSSPTRSSASKPVMTANGTPARASASAGPREGRGALAPRFSPASRCCDPSPRTRWAEGSCCGGDFRNPDA